MAGLVPAIHVLCSLNAWMPGTRPGMTRISIVVLALPAKFFFFVLDEPADHLPPQRLGQLWRQAFLNRPCPHQVDDLLNAPRHSRFCRRPLELPGAIDIGEALADKIDELHIDTVDLRPHLFHVGAVLSLAGCHQATLRRGKVVGRIVMLPCSTSLAAWPAA